MLMTEYDSIVYTLESTLYNLWATYVPILAMHTDAKHDYNSM